MNKPQECAGCPFAISRGGFIQDFVRKEAKLILMIDRPQKNMVNGTARDAYEAKYFRREMLNATGLDEDQIEYSHLLRCKDSLGKKGESLKVATEHCRVYDQFPEGSVLVTNGPLGWKYFSGLRDSRKDWRGYYVEISEQD